MDKRLLDLRRAGALNPRPYMCRCTPWTSGCWTRGARAARQPRTTARSSWRRTLAPCSEP